MALSGPAAAWYTIAEILGALLALAIMSIAYPRKADTMSRT